VEDAQSRTIACRNSAAVAGLVTVGRPEARGVGRARLVAEREAAIGVQAEFELGVRRMIPRARACAAACWYTAIELSRRRSARSRSPISFGCPLEVDRLVVADVGLRRGVKIGPGAGRTRQGRGQRHAGDASGLLVVLPAGAGDVDAHRSPRRAQCSLLGRPSRPVDLVGHSIRYRHEVFGTRLDICSNQNVEIAVSTAPFPESGSGHNSYVRSGGGYEQQLIVEL